MERDFAPVVNAAVLLAQQQGGLLWVEDIAKRIASASPVAPSPDHIAVQLTKQAIRYGVPVALPRLDR